MIYLILLALGLIGGLFIGYKSEYADSIWKYVFAGFFSTLVSIGFIVIIISIVSLTYNGETETIITSTDNPEIILIKEVYVDRDYCDRWFFGSYTVKSELQYIENKGE